MATLVNRAKDVNSAGIALSSVGLDPLSSRNLGNIVSTLPGAFMAATMEGYTGAEREVGGSGDHARVRICFIDYDQNTEQAIWITEHLRANYPDMYVFAVSAYSDPERIIAAMRVGCSEYLLKPILTERVLDGLARVETKHKERSRSKVHGKVISLIGAKGGTGVTSLSLHLALELADRKNHKCLLIDHHAALGDASLYLGTGRHQYSFYELANNTDRLDQELLEGFLLRHSSGLHLLDSPEAADPIHQASPSAIEHTLLFLAGIYEFVIVDCPPGLTDANLACVAQSDQVVIVLTPELPAVRNAVRYVEHLEKLGWSRGKVQIVLNRASKRASLADDRIEKALGRPISWRVPNSYNEVIRAINSGAPVDSRSSDFGAGIRNWAQGVAGTRGKGVAAAQSQNGLFSLFSR